MSQLTVICCSCGDLFYPDNYNVLSIDSRSVPEFYVCDECLAKPVDEGEDIFAANQE